jgi:hypothetical protein
VPNISIHNFGGESGTPVNKIGKEVVKEILNNLRKALERQGIKINKKKIEASLRQKIEQKLGIKSDLDNLKKQLDTNKIEDKTKELSLGYLIHRRNCVLRC